MSHHEEDSCAHCNHHHELVVEDLAVQYHSVSALHNVSFSTSCGTCVALVGPNGAGKSTLLKTIAGLLKADKGQVRWRGTSLKRWSREIAYLPQREEVDWKFPITVRGVVSMGRYPNTGWWRPFSRADRKVVDEALEAMQLEELQDRQISELSGGQQQRVFLARALAQEAHAFLLDEPFTGLDRTSRAALTQVLRKQASEGRLVFASHHDLDTVEEVYDEVLILNREPIAFGSVKDVFHEKNLARAFSAVPEEEEAAV